MCVHVASEDGARRYIAEMYRAYGRPHENITNAIWAWQQWEKWLLDYDLETCQPKAVSKPKPRPKKITGKPGMGRVREAVREIERTAQPAEKKPVKTQATVTV